LFKIFSERSNNPDYNIYTANDKEYSEPPILITGQASLVEKFEIKNKFKSLDKDGVNLLCNFLIQNIPNIIKHKENGVDVDFSLIDSEAVRKIREFIQNYEIELSERLQKEALEVKEKNNENSENLMLVESDQKQDGEKIGDVYQTSEILVNLRDKNIENIEDEKNQINFKSMQVDSDDPIQN
jgi:hypothetical protein